MNVNDSMTGVRNHRISVTHGGSGYFAVMLADYADMQWGTDIVQTGIGRFKTRAEAVEEAQTWAKAENMQCEV